MGKPGRSGKWTVKSFKKNIRTGSIYLYCLRKPFNRLVRKPVRTRNFPPKVNSTVAVEKHSTKQYLHELDTRLGFGRQILYAIKANRPCCAEVAREAAGANETPFLFHPQPSQKGIVSQGRSLIAPFQDDQVIHAHDVQY